MLLGPKSSWQNRSESEESGSESNSHSEDDARQSSSRHERKQKKSSGKSKSKRATIVYTDAQLSGLLKDIIAKGNYIIYSLVFTANMNAFVKLEDFIEFI